MIATTSQSIATMNESSRASRLSRITTAWTLIVQAHDADQEQAAEAQRALMERYIGAAYRYLLAAVRDADVADELFQEFAIRFLRGGFRNADPERGRFRNMVKTSLINLVNDHYRQESKRRQLQREPEAGDAAEPADAPSETIFVDSWREELIAQAWDALAEVERTRGQPFYTLLKKHSEEPQLRSAQLAEWLTSATSPEQPYTDVAVRKILQRSREKLTGFILDEVAHSLGGATLDEVEEELIELGLFGYCKAALHRRRGG